MKDIAIKIDHLSKRYAIGKEKDNSLRGTLSNLFKGSGGAKDEFWALKDINLEINRGDVVGIIGKNGAGKSTLLKILSQITQPTEGRVEINGRVASLLEVGTGFHPELTGRENIYLNGTILGMSRKEVKAKFDEIVAFSGVEKFIDTPVKHYSSGMYVRLAFSVAAHLEPEILIIDEVLAVGDVEFQKKCLGKMQDVAGQGRTVLFVSHNMSAVQNLCNKGIHLEKGKLFNSGDVKRVVSDYYKSITSQPQISTYFTDQHNRKGNGIVRFHSIATYSEGNDTVSIPVSGEKVVFTIELESKIELKNKDIQIDLGIDNERGQRITWISTSLFPDYEINRNTVKFLFDKFPLTAGTYAVTLFITYKGEVSDWIKGGHSFSVEAGNFYETGKLPPSNQNVNMLLNFQLA